MHTESNGHGLLHYLSAPWDAETRGQREYWRVERSSKQRQNGTFGAGRVQWPEVPPSGSSIWRRLVKALKKSVPGVLPVSRITLKN
jgi:hypothetical protein